MNFLNSFTSLLQNPAIFLSLVSFIGLIIQKKSIDKVVSGTLKVMIGVIGLLTSVGIVSGSLEPLAMAVSSMFNVSNFKLIADYGTFLIDNGTAIGIVMLCGLSINIIIAKFSKFKTVFLTGHMMFFYSMLWLAVGVEAKLTGIVLYIFAIICYLASTMILPNLLVKDIENLTKSRSFSIGHSASLFCYLGARFGSLINKPEEDIEKIKLPKSLEFLKDPIITSGISMILAYSVVYFLISKESQALIYTGNVFEFILIKSMTFAAGMTFLLHSIRLMMSELVPAFKGVSDKLVNGAIPALDIPLIFPYGANALMVGFIISLTVSLLSMFVINSMGVSVFAVLPATIACYFDVAPSAIFANNRGGIKAAIIWSALAAIIMNIIVVLAMPLVANTVGSFVQQFGANEESIWIMIFTLFARLLNLIGL